MKSKLTTLELSSTDRNLLEAIKLKTGMKTNAEVLRNLIRTRYNQVADRTPIQLHKEEFIPNKTTFMKMGTIECTGVKGAAAIKLVNRIKRNRIKRNLSKNKSILGQYKLSDGSIVTIP